MGRPAPGKLLPLVTDIRCICVELPAPAESDSDHVARLFVRRVDADVDSGCFPRCLISLRQRYRTAFQRKKHRLQYRPDIELTQ